MVNSSQGVLAILEFIGSSLGAPCAHASGHDQRVRKPLQCLPTPTILIPSSFNESPSRLDGLIPASPDTDTSPLSGRDGGPASSWTRSTRVTLGGRGCARPASEGSPYRAATAAPRPRGREAKGADAPARRLRAALISHHQGSMV